MASRTRLRMSRAPRTLSAGRSIAGSPRFARNDGGGAKLFQGFPKFSKEIPRKFQAFPNFSKDSQTFSFAVAREIKDLSVSRAGM
jgi:hypothetical protein